MKTTLKTLLVLGTFAGISSAAMGQTLVQFLADDTMENGEVQLPSFLEDNLSLTDEGIFGTEGGNILIKSPTTAWVDEDHFGYGPGSGAYAGARSDTGYTLTITADSGFTFDLDTISFRHRATGAGPGTVGISVNGTNFSGTGDSVSTSVGTYTSDALSLTDLTEATIVLQGWDSGGTGNGEFQMNDLQINGAVTAIPEPSTYAAIFAGLAFGLVVWRRKFARRDSRK
ncbi:MAG: PEP-CTERM sorting domain-containing protein [Opitutales bacterium]|nr:PEP-CTERM sorting domain-containing protein [Opitutales bacterium]MCH8541375.1 PEP-CTERM sorting domain-containing protein [Opitutales bacterium]